VTAHGGAITVGDTPGGGARFVVHLPIGSGTDPILEDASAPAVAVPGRRLVIVEDEADVAHSLAEILAPDGYHIDLADSGAAALARIRAVDYDAILSDVRMADIGGLGWVFRPTAKNEVAAVALSCHRGESRRASRGLRLASRREAVCVVDG
jgi:CheY-like chemotaxis protein